VSHSATPGFWSARLDSTPRHAAKRRRRAEATQACQVANPDLHGLNVLRLPFAPRAEMVTTGGFEPPLDRLSTCCLCQVGLHGHWSLWVDSNHHLTG
jgi:hypothetical protein